MPACGKGWGERCATANPGGKCVCSCGGDNHGVYWVFKKAFGATASLSSPGGGGGGGGGGGDGDDGEIIPLSEQDWLDTVLQDKKAFAAGLVELGLDEKIVNEGLSRFDAVTREASAGSAVHTWFFRTEEERREFKKFIYSHIAKLPLTNWLGLLERRVEETTDLRFKIPLFKLHSPKVRGSKVSYVESEAGAASALWSVTVFGTGLGKVRKFAVKYRNTFVSSNGDCKLIYAPVTLKVERVATYLRGEFISRRLRSELILERAERVSKCIESLSEDECARESSAAEDFDYEADFSGDRTDDTHRVEWSGSWSETIDVKLGLSALDSTAECRVTVTREREIGLVFELPAGHRYQLKQCREVRGIAWAVAPKRSDAAPPELPIDAAPPEQPPNSFEQPVDDAPADQPTVPGAVERREPAPAQPTHAQPDRDPPKNFLDSIRDKLSGFWRKPKK